MTHLITMIWMANLTISTPSSNSRKILITLEGEVLNFQGNYRDSIENIQDFANDLTKLNDSFDLSIFVNFLWI